MEYYFCPIELNNYFKRVGYQILITVFKNYSKVIL